MKYRPIVFECCGPQFQADFVLATCQNQGQTNQERTQKSEMIPESPPHETREMSYWASDLEDCPPSPVTSRRGFLVAN